MGFYFLLARKTRPFMKGGRVMTYKQIEASREVRLWIRDIVVPVATVAVGLLTVPEVREAVAAKATDIKRSINIKLKKD